MALLAETTYSSQSTTLRTIDEPLLERAHPVRRALAIILDFLFFSWLVLSVESIAARVFGFPSLGWTAAPANLAIVLLLLSRDFLFGGRGVGKRLLMIHVTDKSSGKPPSLRQSIIRNATLFWSCLALQLYAMSGASPQSLQLASYLSSTYVVIAFLLEGLLMWFPKVERLGDRLANTISMRDRSTCSSNF